MLNRLGIIPTFFFLVVLYPFKDHPGPYRNVEKGLLILYHLLKGLTHSEMGAFIPQSSFYDIYKSFYGRENGFNKELDKKIMVLLHKMFSDGKIRLMSARLKTSEPFDVVTMLIDGHDTRGTQIGSDPKEQYSYKFKKSGFRTQVCMDVNGMVLLTSESHPCKDYTDGVMLKNMNIQDKIEEYDCIALDGAYNYTIKDITEGTDLKDNNFCCPIRKPNGVELTEPDVEFNKKFGSFRSSIEAIFGEIGTIFETFNNKKSIRCTNRKTFNIRFKLACLLLNIKKCVNLGAIQHSPQHISWLGDRFDYPDVVDSNKKSHETTTLKETTSRFDEMRKFQKKILDNLQDSDEEMEDYDVEKVINHRRKGKDYEYHVQCVGYKETTWEPAKNFRSHSPIREYWHSIKVHK